jgi:hypothetical protein
MRNGFKGAREFDADSFAAGQAIVPGLVGCVGTSEILPHHFIAISNISRHPGALCRNIPTVAAFELFRRGIRSGSDAK